MGVAAGCLNALVVCLLYFTDGVNISQMGPFFPLEAREKGVSQTVVGVVSSSFNVVNLFAAFVLVKVVRPGLEPLVFGSGALIAAVATVPFGLSAFIHGAAPFAVASIVCRAGMGLGGCMMYATGPTVVTSVLPSRYSGKLLGLYEASGVIGVMMGPAIGSFIYQLGGYVVTFASVGCLEIAMVVIALVSLQLSVVSTAPPSEETKRPSFASMLRLINGNIMFISFLASLLMSVGMFLNVTLAIHIKELFGYDNAEAARFFVVFPIFSASFNVVSGAVTDRGRAGLLMVAGGFMTSLALVLLAAPGSFPSLANRYILVVTLSVLGASITTGFSPPFFLLVAEIRRRHSGLVSQSPKLLVTCWITVCYSVISISVQVLIGGWLTQQFGFYCSSLLLAGVTFLATILAGVALHSSGVLLGKLVDESQTDEETQQVITE